MVKSLVGCRLVERETRWRREHQYRFERTQIVHKTWCRRGLEEIDGGEREMKVQNTNNKILHKNKTLNEIKTYP